MERYKVYFQIKDDEYVSVYHTSASCEQEAIWQWQASFFAKKYECEFLGVKLVSPEKNH